MTTLHAPHMFGRRRLLLFAPACHGMVVPGNSDVLGATKACNNPAGRHV